MNIRERLIKEGYDLENTSDDILNVLYNQITSTRKISEDEILEEIARILDLDFIPIERFIVRRASDIAHTDVFNLKSFSEASEKAEQQSLIEANVMWVAEELSGEDDNVIRRHYFFNGSRMVYVIHVKAIIDLTMKELDMATEKAKNSLEFRLA